MRWIDQDEQSPKCDEDVLVFSCGNFFVACVGKEGYWEDPIDGRPLLGVSHWMHLPNHPKRYRRYRKVKKVS